MDGQDHKVGRQRNPDDPNLAGLRCALLPQLGNLWLHHYNADMRPEIALCSLGKSFNFAMVVCAICLLILPATAQRFVTHDSSAAQPQATNASKPMLATLPSPPALQPATPALPAPHAFWDRTNLALFPGIAATRVVDYASTRNFQARGRQEILLPDDVVNNSAGFASLEAAATMTSVGVSYLLHRTGHHKLERWISIGHISVTAFGDVRNYALESRHRR
jgi:hypothetical protein